MFDKIMAKFGYARIPKAAVLLSMDQEHFLAACKKHETDPQGKGHFELRLEAQKSITGLLRSGRLISYAEKDLK